jgi:hypothetical protein
MSGGKDFLSSQERAKVRSSVVMRADTEVCPYKKRKKLKPCPTFSLAFSL